jgi:hypothetical protein
VQSSALPAAANLEVKSVEINRNQYFLAGLVILFIGLQLRLVETFVLNERASKFLAERVPALASADDSVLPAAGPTPRKTIRPPEWIGYAVISVGAVLILHSLAMKRPGG